MTDRIEQPHSAPVGDGVSRARLIALRALYAFIVVGLALFVWPAFLARLPAPAHYHGIVLTMLAAFSILCAIGIRYPLQMLPILLWELLWKAMWLSIYSPDGDTCSRPVRYSSYGCRRKQSR